MPALKDTQGMEKLALKSMNVLLAPTVAIQMQSVPRQMVLTPVSASLAIWEMAKYVTVSISLLVGIPLQ